MRIALRGFGYLLAAYLLSILALGAVTTKVLDESSALIMEETARVAGEAVASTVNESIIDELLGGSSARREQLIRDLNRSERRSSLINSITVVNGSGEIVSRDRSPAAILPKPEEVFGTDRRSLLEAIPAGTTAAPDYVFTVPLERDGELVGYLRLGLSTDPIKATYARARRITLAAALVGFVVIAILGFLLHWHLRRQSRAIAAAISSAMSGEGFSKEGKGEFSDVFAAVSDLTGEITRLRRQARVRSQVTRLSEMNDVGAVVVDRNLGLMHASPVARELLHVDDGGEGWSFIRSLLRDHIDQAGNGDVLDIELPGSVIRCHIHFLPEESRLLLLRDSRIIRSIESDLRVAAYSRSLARLFMGFAHDFKAPLNALLLNVELLKSSFEDEPKGNESSIQEDQRRWAAVVEEEIGRLRRMIESLLGFAAPAKDQRAEFDLRDLLDELESLIRPQARQQEVELRTDRPQNSVVVDAHRDRIKQAIVNVAINALEVMPEGGSLDLALRSVDGHGVLSIRDSGPGIPEKVRDKIFTLHFTTKETGTGIGLFVGNSILNAEGGFLRLKDTGPSGTTFEVGLPLVSQTERRDRTAE